MALTDEQRKKEKEMLKTLLKSTPNKGEDKEKNTGGQTAANKGGHCINTGPVRGTLMAGAIAISCHPPENGLA